MPSKQILPVIVLSGLVTLPALSTAGHDDTRPGSGRLQGTFASGGATPIDPPAQEPGNTHMRLHLTGDAAVAMFHQMPVATQPTVCVDGLSKTIGGTQCVLSKGDAECWLTIELRTQTIDGDWTC